METRNQASKTLPGGGPCFISIKSFSLDTLPTKMQVVQRMLYEKNYRTYASAKKIASELIDLWVKCNVYTKSEIFVANFIANVMDEFSKLLRYPKSKIKHAAFGTKKDNFLKNIDQLFDIFCDQTTQRRKLEKQHLLQMTSEDFNFYEDQKGPRNLKCTNELVPLTNKDIKFKTRYSKRAGSSQAGTSSQKDSPKYITSEEDHDNFDEEFFDSDFVCPCPLVEHNQNRKNWPNLVSMCERFRTSDREGAAIANAVMYDIGYISESNTKFVIDRSKLRREREKYRKEIIQKEKNFCDVVDGIYLDGRKDATLSTRHEGNNKHYSTTVLEEHYVVIGEPGELYLTHFSPTDGKGESIALGVHQFVEGTPLEKNLKIVGVDGTAVMTGLHSGLIRNLELKLGKSLQWSVCLLHANELPLRHVFIHLDGTTNSPDSFKGPIGQQLNFCAHELPVANYTPIANRNFPLLSWVDIVDLSSDQYYAYRICRSVISGEVTQDLSLLEIGPVVHSRWLTLACRILRFYVSKESPSENLILLANFCIHVYFPSWFDIKKHKTFTNGATNLLNMVKRVNTFYKKEVRDIALKSLQRNAFFAHPENVLVAMLGDADPDNRRVAVNKIQKIRLKVQKTSTNSSIERQRNGNVRKFVIPKINRKSRSLKTFVDLEDNTIEEPPLTRDLSTDELEDVIENPLIFGHPCHNQAVERHVKLVTEASATVTTFERRDGLIRQRIRSRKIMKDFETKKQFSA